MHQEQPTRAKETANEACYDSLCGPKDSSLSYDVLLNKRL